MKQKKLLLLIVIVFLGEVLLSQNIDTVKFAKWINENSIELEGTGFTQLAEKLSDKTVIGLGECVHGSKTINNLRFDIAKALIENSNFYNIAFEMPFNIGLRINHFLQTGEGNLEQILKMGHFFTNSTEMLDFIKWIKNHNDNSDKKINLYGFDIQSNIDLVEDLLKYYVKTDKEAENLTTTLIKIFVDNKFWSFRNYPEPLQDSVITIISRLAEKHRLNRKDYILTAGFIEYEYSAKRIEVLSNCLQMMNSGYGQSLKMRDSCNAELVQWIKKFEGEKSRIILFAHNGHLGKSLWLTPRERILSTQGFYEDHPQELISGYYLSEIFGEEYYFIGTQFGSGFFMGFDSENGNLLSKLEVTLPEPYSFPHLLQQAKKKSQYFIDFAISKTTPRQIINYFCSFQSFYEIGAAYEFKYAKTRLVDYFDAIIYIDKIEESKMLKFEE